MTWDIDAIRAQFPSLHRPVNGQAQVFFDNPAGTQVPQRVIDAVSEYYLTMNANQGGVFRTSMATDAMVAGVREKLALLLNAPRADEVVIGPNMTTLNFGLSRALAQDLGPGDELVLTRMDHDANVSPWLRIAADRGLTVRWVNVRREDGTLDLDSLEAALSKRTRLVATVHASNALGTVNPVSTIAGMAHAAGALHVVDAVQSTPHLLIDVQAIGCDFLLCSAYKFFGPHAGVMWGRYDLLAALPAYKVRPAHDEPPFRWETGTPAFELIAGVGAAVDYLASLSGQAGTSRATLAAGYAAMHAYEQTLAVHLLEMLQRFPKLHIAGLTDPARLSERVPTVICTIEGYTPKQVAEHLAAEGIYVWDGNYYALEVMGVYGQEAMLRIGLAHYNTHAEIDRLEAALRRLLG